MYYPHNGVERFSRPPVIKHIREVTPLDVMTTLDLLPQSLEISGASFLTRQGLVEVYLGVPKDFASLFRKALAFESPNGLEEVNISHSYAVLDPETNTFTLVQPPTLEPRSTKGYRVSSNGVEILDNVLSEPSTVLRRAAFYAMKNIHELDLTHAQTIEEGYLS